MRLFEKCYAFLVISSVSGVIGRIFGGHGALSSGGASFVSGGDRDPILLAFNLAVALATVALAVLKLPAMILLLRNFAWLVVLYTFGALSMAWSVDRATTFRSIVYLLVYGIAAANLALRFEPEALVWLIGKTMAALAALSAAGQLLLPPLSYGGGEWAGVFLHKDGLGVAMAVGVVSLLAVDRPWTLLRGFELLLCAALLVLSGAAGAYLWALAGLSTLLFLHVRRHLRLLMSLAVASALLVPPLVVPDFVSFATGLLGKDASFTGRTEVWAIAVRMIAVRPWLGYGEGAFWSTSSQTVGSLLGNWQPQHAHNGGLEICLNLGLVGLVLVLSTLADALRKMRIVGTEAGAHMRPWCAAVFVVLLVHAVDEAAFLQVSCLWFMFLLSSFALWVAERTSAAQAVCENAWDGNAAGPEMAPDGVARTWSGEKTRCEESPSC